MINVTPFPHHSLSRLTVCPAPTLRTPVPADLSPFLTQNWADNFISELNDTHIEADLRLRHAPPPVSGAESGRGGEEESAQARG